LKVLVPCNFGGGVTVGEAKERWRILCEQAVGEQDPEKFVARVEELIQELEAKEREMKGAARLRPPADGLSADS
jgi:hypothetical protein